MGSFLGSILLQWVRGLVNPCQYNYFTFILPTCPCPYVVAVPTFTLFSWSLKKRKSGCSHTHDVGPTKTVLPLEKVEMTPHLQRTARKLSSLTVWVCSQGFLSDGRLWVCLHPRRKASSLTDSYGCGHTHDVRLPL